MKRIKDDAEHAEVEVDFVESWSTHISSAIPPSYSAVRNTFAPGNAPIVLVYLDPTLANRLPNPLRYGEN